MPLFPLDPPPSLYPLFWGWLSLCVKLYRGVITAPLEKGARGWVGALLEQEAGRCSCLNWPTSTESEQPGNYATAPNPFPMEEKKKPNQKSPQTHSFSASLHLGRKKACSRIYPRVTFYSHTFCPCWKFLCSPFYVINCHFSLRWTTWGLHGKRKNSFQHPFISGQRAYLRSQHMTQAFQKSAPAVFCTWNWKCTNAASSGQRFTHL